jgi:uncharacterized OsmC-like protein
MRLILETEASIRLSPNGPDLVVEPQGDVVLSPFHLLGASLALCTWSVLASWAEQANLPVEELELVVDWAFGGDPVRVSEVGLDVVWPGLPPARLEGARRAARYCTVHHTLEHGSRLTTRVLESRRDLDGGGAVGGSVGASG